MAEQIYTIRISQANSGGLLVAAFGWTTDQVQVRPVKKRRVRADEKQMDWLLDDGLVAAVMGELGYWTSQRELELQDWLL